MVTFISECEKKALNRTRRVLDSFANRIGSRTWQTVITEEGLQAVKTLLRKTASKNTAVSCHWIRSRSRSDLIWVVGDRSKFDYQGHVPVNFTQKDVLKSHWENSFHNAEVIAILAGIAGLFHDFGKANKLFQQKLNPKNKGKNFEPYRHEWVSLRLFQAFVGDKTDNEWLQQLANVSEKDELVVLDRLIKDTPTIINNPLSKLPPLAKLISWLIVSHHRLPIYPVDKADNQPDYQYINQWLDNFDSLWNSVSSFDNWDNKIRDDNWSFPHGTPLLRMLWRDKAKDLATQALSCQRLTEHDWFNQRFTAHLSRLALMLSDHYYSSSSAITKWQDSNYQCYANTETNPITKKRQYKQKLDEHNIGVGHNAYLLARQLPKLKKELPALGFIKELTKSQSKDPKFHWQDKAYKKAVLLKESSKDYGFFGINMASTGRGKTLGNARIMYALSNKKTDCRFSIALGLRTLTLQTGDALSDKLPLDKNDIAVLIGSQAVKQLHENNKNAQQLEEKKDNNAQNGSESLDDLLADIFVSYEGAIHDGALGKWLAHDPKIEKLIQAPILVSTIDHLIPATEGTRGGKQIAPMLRLLTSDLVLDEPDDFGLEDLPALCRLVNWAGMLGSRVLLSTATMPPAMAYALFEAYQAGRKDFTSVNGEPEKSGKVCCAWFDEFTTANAIFNDEHEFKQQHTEFVEKRIINLRKEKQVLCKAKLLPVSCANANEALSAMSAIIHNAIHQLHEHHKQTHESGKTVSIGLVRMANINPLVAVAKLLFSQTPQANYRIHYCVYHGQYPLAVRSYIEQRLDATLTRHDEHEIWQQPEIKHALETYSEQHHVFVVLATSVAEVGRDHDYDWAIAEPSSMRSLIQLAGRIQRHRKKQAQTENLLILSKNVKALQNISPAYNKPGFEANNRLLANHDLTEILKPEHYKEIKATPRIQKPNGKLEKDGELYLDFVQMEQWALFQRLLGAGKEQDNAKHWWVENSTWCAELQRRQPFRKSTPDAPYCLYYEEECERIYWAAIDNTSKPVIYLETDIIKNKNLIIETGNQSWLNLDTELIYSKLSYRLDLSVEKISKKFGELRLREDKERVIEWCYNTILGVYCE
jgi:CRISPR-associated endonuclease/helicase Cas3